MKNGLREVDHQEGSSPSLLLRRSVCKHDWRDRATIEAREDWLKACPASIQLKCSEVRLDAYRETDGDGQGSGLSGEAESQFAGLRFARLAASQ